MTKQTVLERIKEGAEFIDRESQFKKAVENKETKIVEYFSGVKALSEDQFCKELVNWWKKDYPEDFDDINKIGTQYRYPEDGSIKCDIVFSSKGYKGEYKNEWAIEFKKTLIIGHNGKDYEQTPKRIFDCKVKHSSLINDSKRLHNSLIAENKLIIAYGFKYDKDKLAHMRTLHPDPKHKTRLDEIQKILNIPDNKGCYNLEESMNNLQFILKGRGLINEDFEVIDFWAPRHPCGGYGEMYVFQIN